jgi:hypothetical protein
MRQRWSTGRVDAFSEGVIAMAPSVVGYGLAILIGVAIVPEIAAFALLAVAARSVFAAEGEVRLTFAPLGGDR